MSYAFPDKLQTLAWFLKHNLSQRAQRYPARYPSSEIDSMFATIYKKFFLDSALFLPFTPEGAQALHGHRIEITLEAYGPIDTTYGWVQDIQDIKKAFMPLYAQLDHRLLNDVPGLENPTAENLAIWIWTRLKPRLPLLSRVSIQDTATSGVVYEGEVV